MHAQAVLEHRTAANQEAIWGFPWRDQGTLLAQNIAARNALNVVTTRGAPSAAVQPMAWSS